MLKLKQYQNNSAKTTQWSLRQIVYFNVFSTTLIIFIIIIISLLFVIISLTAYFNLGTEQFPFSDDWNISHFIFLLQGIRTLCNLHETYYFILYFILS